MPPHEHDGRLERVAANQLDALIHEVPIGSTLRIDSSSPVCDTLELLIPEILRREHAEWQRESIDGFFFASSLRSDNDAAVLAGTCILISDQTVTPFAVDLDLAPEGGFRSLRIRLGEAGAGALGISGPGCKSRAAKEMLLALDSRLDQIEWVYEVGA
jgi:hypothetical protein